MNTGISVEFKGIKCSIYVGRYETGNIALVLICKSTKEVVAVASINLAPGGCYSDFDRDVAISQEVENEGLFEILKKEGVISDPYITVFRDGKETPLCTYSGPLPE